MREFTCLNDSVSKRGTCEPAVKAIRGYELAKPKNVASYYVERD